MKNHRLPFERTLIAASRPKDGVRIPPPELEVAILAYRTLLKYRDADATKDLLGVGHRGGIRARRWQSCGPSSPPRRRTRWRPRCASTCPASRPSR